MNTIPRPEHPNPQFERSNWLNLNGTWQFEIDHGASGRARGLVEKNPLDMTINVPFCPESELSGVAYKDFMAAVWYRRTFTLPAEAAGQRVMLHFAHFEKEAEREDERHYLLRITYDTEDETELLVRVLSFGPRVEVLAPTHFRTLIRERLIKQKSCGLK